MMFLRHEMFARKAIVERLRKRQIGAVIGLLLVLSMAIIAIVKAAGSHHLENIDSTDIGLTNGNITGVIVKADGTAATNIARNETLKLNLEFTIEDYLLSIAKEANSWTYDLSSLTHNNYYYEILNNSEPIDIVNDGVVIAKYTISNGMITIALQKTQAATNWWSSHTQGVKFGLTVKLALSNVGVMNSLTIQLPGTVSLSNPSGNSTNTVYFSTPAIMANGSVYDSYSQDFKTGSDNLVGIEKDGNNYYATYNVDFYGNAIFNDYTAVITLSSNQTFDQNEIFEMSGCSTSNCVHDYGVPSINITDYVDFLSDRKVYIDLADVFEYCESHGSECEAAHINYSINDEMTPNSSNYNDYYIQFRANLGQTNPSGNGAIYEMGYRVSGNADAVSSSGSLSYKAGIPGSKTGTCVNGSTSVAGIPVCNDDGDGNVYIDYQITVGDADTDLSNISIIDRITDNQVLEGDISLTAPDSTTTTLQKTNTCSANNENDCVISAAIDSNFSSDLIKLFSHAFTIGDAGPWTISYRVKVASQVALEDKDIENIIDIKIGQDTYTDIWSTTSHYDFDTPMYLTKNESYTQAADGWVYWDIFVYGPAGDSPYLNVTIDDLLSYDTAKYSNGAIDTAVVDATKTYNGETTDASDYSGAIVDGHLQIIIPSLSPQTIYHFTVVTEADAFFRDSYAGEFVALENRACRNDSVIGSYCTEAAHATILAPHANEITKTGVQTDSVFTWELNESGGFYDHGGRDGIAWTVTVNPNAGSIPEYDGTDYEPYFTDIIPEGLYLTNTQMEGSIPACDASGCDPRRDVSQRNYETEINVKRVIPSLEENNEQTVSNIPVMVMDGVIEPINLAELFNDGNCGIPSHANPALSCAGINGVTYEVTYVTAIADDIYYDFANAHSFTSQARLLDYSFEKANTAGTAVYKSTTAIKKFDVTNTNLDSLNKITYMVTVNESGYTYLNGGEPYAQDATIPNITVTDQLASNVELSTDSFSSLNLENGYPEDGNLTSSTESVICTTTDWEVMDDCTAYYDDTNRTLVVRVPDGATRYIWYTVTVTNPTLEHDTWFENTAVFHTGAADIESTVRKQHIIDTTAGHAISNGVLNIKNIDADNFLTNISGAKFKLVRVNYNQNGSLGNETVIDLNGADAGTDATTDANGRIRISNLCGYATTASADCLDGGQLYYWQETSAPSPYIMADNADKHYFVLYNEEVIASDTEANRALAQAAADSIKARAANNISEISVLQSNYEWTVSNRQQAETTIAIEQRVTGNTARIEDSFTISIEVTDPEGNPIDGFYEAYTYNVSDPTNITEEGIIFTNGLATITADYGVGILIDELPVDGRYSITDVNATYIHNFICTDLDSYYGCDSATSGSGTFVADKNPDFSYPTVAGAGQRVVINSESSSAITGITNKKPSLVIATTFGSVVAILGIAVARRLRH